MCWTWSLCFCCYKYLAGVKNKSGKWVVIFPSYPSFRGGKWDGSSLGHFCLEIREIKHPFSFPTVKSDDEALVLLLPVKRSRAIKHVYLKKTWAPKYFSNCLISAIVAWRDGLLLWCVLIPFIEACKEVELFILSFQTLGAHDGIAAIRTTQCCPESEPKNPHGNKIV